MQFLWACDLLSILKLVSQKVTAHCFNPGRTNSCIAGVLGVVYWLRVSLTPLEKKDLCEWGLIVKPGIFYCSIAWFRYLKISVNADPALVINAFITGSGRNQDSDEHHYAAQEDLQSPISVPAYRGNHSHLLFTVTVTTLLLIQIAVQSSNLVPHWLQLCQQYYSLPVISKNIFKLKF